MDADVTAREEYTQLIQRITEYTFNIHKATGIPIKVLVRKYMYNDINNLIKGNLSELEKAYDRTNIEVQKNSKDNHNL
jgi:vacuolar-type H+-ATPase subunit C/Vma6